MRRNPANAARNISLGGSRGSQKCPQENHPATSGRRHRNHCKDQTCSGVETAVSLENAREKGKSRMITWPEWQDLNLRPLRPENMRP